MMRFTSLSHSCLKKVSAVFLVKPIVKSRILFIPFFSYHETSQYVRAILEKSPSIPLQPSHQTPSFLICIAVLINRSPTGPCSVLLGYLFLYFLRVSKIDTMGQTHIIGTGGYEPFIHPVIAEVTLLGDAFFRIKGYGIIGTGLQAEFASDTPLRVQNHNPIVSLENRLFRAGPDTFRFITVSAHIHPKNKFRFASDDPGAFFINRYQLDPYGGIVFLFACHFTGFAPPT
jgi:hypothetical protein